MEQMNTALTAGTASSAETYLSVVVTTRNDDHGGDPLKRLQAFVNTFAAQCRRTQLAAEIIVVEWNPPPDRPRVGELLRMTHDAPFAVHFVEVPPEIHRRLRYADVLPLFQMIAKNVGVRRARGRFVLCTNIDIVFSNELVEYLASGRLEAGHIYRVDRHDIEADYPAEARLEEQMAYCRTHQIRLHTRLGTCPVDPAGRPRALEPDVVGSPGVTLGDGWRAREGDATDGFYRWASQEAHFSIDRTAGANLVRGAVLDVEVEPNPYQPDSWVELEMADAGRRLVQRRVSRRGRLRVALDDGVARHEIVMRMIDSSGGREYLPLFECREQLCWRVRHVSVGTAPSHDYDVALWRRATNDSPELLVEHTPSGVEITTDPGRYSYCAQFGPLESPADGVYEFLLEYVPIEGRFSLGVMDDERGRWLPSTVVEIGGDGVQFLGLSVDVPRGTKFSLVASNHLPNGGVSRFGLRRLFGSVPLEALRQKQRDSIVTRVVRRLGGVAVVLTAPFRWARTAASSVEQQRELEARIAALAPLAELAPFAQLLRDHRPVELHQNACGDFQLMDREHWFALKGYPELEMFSMSLDGLFEVLAHSAGIREQVFEMPLCIYHLEHEKGSGWTPEGEAQLRKRIAESGITWLDASTVHIWAAYMQWLRRPMIFNGAGWGLGDVVLPETTVQQVANNV
jgi:hypothetical protein